MTERLSFGAPQYVRARVLEHVPLSHAPYKIDFMSDMRFCCIKLLIYWEILPHRTPGPTRLTLTAGHTRHAAIWTSGTGSLLSHWHMPENGYDVLRRHPLDDDGHPVRCSTYPA